MADGKEMMWDSSVKTCERCGGYVVRPPFEVSDDDACVCLCGVATWDESREFPELKPDPEW